MTTLAVYYRNGEVFRQTGKSRFTRQRLTLLLTELRDTNMHPNVTHADITCEECKEIFATVQLIDGDWYYRNSENDGYGHYETCDREVPESGVYGFDGREYYDLESIERHVPSEY